MRHRTLTPRQALVRDAIRQLSTDYGCAPTLREIGDVAQLKSPSSVGYVVDALEKLGIIRREPTQQRGAVVIGDPCCHCAGTGTS